MMKFLSPITRLRVFCLCSGAIAATAPVTAAEQPTYIGPLAAGSLQAPPKQESSGLAISRRSPDILWTHDDSGGAPVLYAVDTSGRKRGSLRVRGVKNEDWEDMASF